MAVVERLHQRDKMKNPQAKLPTKPTEKAIPWIKQEGRLKMVLNGFYLALSVVGATFVFSLFAEGRFASLMGNFGVSMINSEAGVYADCSKRENRDIPYCQPKEGRADRTWKDIKKGGSAFTLY